MGSLRDIRLFVAAYEARSFTAAANREHATQSGVSQHIRKLEERFQVRLFDRNKSRVTPTPAGDSYYRSCIDVLSAYEAANRAVKPYASGLDGEIVVGLMPTMTRCVLAPALKRFTEAHPNAIVRVVEGYSAALTDQLQAGELDFAVVPAAPGTIGVRSRLFLRTAEVLVSSTRSPLRHLDPVRLSALGPVKMVLPARINTRRLTLETYFASNGVEIERILELDAMMATLDLVARSDWVAILPGILMADDYAPRLFTINRLAEPELTLDLVLITPARQPLSPVAAAFLEALEVEGLRLNESWQVARASEDRASDLRTDTLRTETLRTETQLPADA